MLKKILIRVRFFLIAPFVDLQNEKLLKDIRRWKSICHISGNDKASLAYLLHSYKEFRNLFFFRNRGKALRIRWFKFWYPPLETLYLESKEIGGGLFIQHGFSCMVAAERIGENCWVNQQVTIGFNGHGNAPVIGDNVYVYCGAKVLGEITIGDGAVIGANAVVVRDVESGAVMGGVPAKRIR